MLWLFFIVWLAWANAGALLGSTAVVGVMLMRGGWQEARRYLRRSRVLLLVVWLANAWQLPGTPLWHWWGISGPSMQGIAAASLATWHWMLVLMALAVLMSRLNREQLLSAIYHVLRPMQMLGLPAQRVAVRLWLTLHYAENLLAEQRHASLKQRLNQLFVTPALLQWDTTWVSIEQQSLDWRDGACWLAVFAVFASLRWLPTW